MSTKTISAAIFAPLCLCLFGCGIKPDTIRSLRDAVTTVSNARAAIPVEETIEAVPVAYEPPFPDRVDPFSFPNDAPVQDSSTTITTVAQVEVLGFAHVDEPRVFLKTKETTKSLKVGDMTDGVVVIEIDSPRVRLQMGTLVWTATMFDNAAVEQQ